MLLNLIRVVLLIATPFGGTGAVLRLGPREPDRVLISAGEFTMGATDHELRLAARMCLDEGGGAACLPSAFQDESPERLVRLSAYKIDIAEVTNAAYGRCVRSAACTPPAVSPDDDRFWIPEAPVVGVSWQQAQDYCRFTGGRLPTEAEWERAARGAAGHRFPWGNNWNPHLCNHANAGELRSRQYDGYRAIAPARSYPGGRSAFGLYDMAGNAAEWVQDFYGEYEASDRFDPRGAAQAAERVLRGGSWRTPGVLTRVTNRLHRPEAAHELDIGFRCAEDVRR